MRGTELRVRPPALLEEEDMSCKCQKCGLMYKVDIIVNDVLWKKISPKKSLVGLLCGKCIIDALEARGHGAFNLSII